MHEKKDAETVWGDYLANTRGFQNQKDRAYAEDNIPPDPSVTFMLVPEIKKLTLPYEELGKEAVATVNLGELTGHNRPLDYVHAREHNRGGGYPSLLLRAAQSWCRSRSGRRATLTAKSAPCRGWSSSLLLLKNDFTASMALWNNDLPYENEEKQPVSETLYFKWESTTTKEDTIAFINQVLQKVEQRDTERARQYAKDLKAVLEKLELEKDTPPPPPPTSPATGRGKRRRGTD